MSKTFSLLAAAIALSFSAGSALAAVSATQAAALKSNLTPLGAEKAGNAAGTIPAWTGGLTKPPADYKGPGTHHTDPFPGDKPLFVISKANLDQYKDHLTPGQIGLINAYPSTFKIPVYQTRRTGAAPQWVYDNTFANATTAKLSEGGNGFTDAYGGTPFPIPQSGVEALWNHIARYRGTYVVRHANEAMVQGGGNKSIVASSEEVQFNYYDPKGNYAGLNNTLFNYMTFTTAPARLAGGGTLVHETLDQVKEPRQAWAYSPGQRRVRRAPTVAYDSPVESVNGMHTVDDVDMFNGAPDRYDWKLVGKKEIYIPYNNYRLGSPDVKYDSLLMPGHINPDYTRYELHRVWVVEGNLKPGMRHIYSKRVLFLDEDSWGAAVVDQYDGRGQLWRVSQAFLKNYYELPTTWTGLDTFYDLQARTYSVQGMDSEEKTTNDFSQTPPGDGAFTPSAMRRKASR